jgi:hypothetical protein
MVGKAEERKAYANAPWSRAGIDVSRCGRVNLLPLLKVRAAKMASSWMGFAEPGG